MLCGVETSRLSSGPVRAVDSHLHLFIARSAVVRRCYCTSHLARPQLGTRVRGQNSRRKTADHRNQVRPTHVVVAYLVIGEILRMVDALCLNRCESFL